MPLGYLNLVLHAHLPYVRHPEYPVFLEEQWLFEAISETYLPLLRVLDALERDAVPFRLTLSVTPTLAGMLSDPLLQDRYQTHLKRLSELAEREVERTRWEPEFHPLAVSHLDQFARTRALYESLGRNPLNGFSRHQQAGALEIIGCAATHALLPTLVCQQGAIRAQIEQGCREHERHFGIRPRGMWLPECGFAPGMDRILADCGVGFVFVDTHGVLLSSPMPRQGVYAPLSCPGSGLVVAARDLESSRQVWSRMEGYPGDPAYRDFYRDIGYDLDLEYLSPYLPGQGQRAMLGIKYHRITGPGEKKLPYDAMLAAGRAREHAAHFLQARETQVGYLAESMGGKPALITAPYDAELFGHWWHEGPQWLEHLFRLLSKSEGLLEPVHLPAFLNRHPNPQVAMPGYSTWGEGGYCSFWLNGNNDWIYPHIHAVAERMRDLAKAHPDPGPLIRRALNQAGRECLLLQSSDWAFILSTGAHAAYAAKRIRDHTLNFLTLESSIRHQDLDLDGLARIESMNNPFPDLDYRVFALDEITAS